MNLRIFKKLSKDTVRDIRFGLLCFGISLFLYLPFLQKPNFLHGIDELWLNFLIRNYSKETIKDERIVLLFLDKTTKEVLNIKGSIMPSFYLKLLNKLEEMKPKVIAFDLLLSDYRDDPAQKKFVNKSILNKVIHPVYQDTDGALRFSMDNPGLSTVGSINLGTESIKNKAISYIKGGGERYYFLPLVMAAAYKDAQIKLIKGKNILINDTKIPLDYLDTFFIKYYRNPPSHVFLEFKLEEFLTDKIEENVFKNKIVVVASSAAISHDMHPTPLGTYAGAEILATVIKNILDKDFLCPIKNVYIYIGTLALVLLQSLIKKRAAQVFFVTVIFLSAILLVSYFLFTNGLYFDLSLPAVAMSLNYLFLSLHKAREVDELLNLHSTMLIDMSKNTFKGEIHPQKWFEFMLELICKNVRGQRGAIVLIKETNLEFFCGYNFTDISFNRISGYIKEDVLPSLEKTRYFSINLKKENPVLAGNISGDAFAFFLLLGKEGEVGVLLIEKQEGEYFTKEQLREILIASIFIGVYLEDTFLIEKKKQSFLETIFALARAIEARDPYTHDHSMRVSALCIGIAEKMGLNEKEIEIIKNAGLLHDIGKIGVPEAILQKEGKLTEEEFNIMKKHPVIGAQILASIEEMRKIIPLVLHHHEKFAGGGYPDGKKGEEIPLGARILAVCDIYDAMTTDRPYRKGMSREKALEEMLRAKGVHLDPKILDILMDIVI